MHANLGVELGGCEAVEHGEVEVLEVAVAPAVVLPRLTHCTGTRHEATGVVEMCV